MNETDPAHKITDRPPANIAAVDALRGSEFTNRPVPPVLQHPPPPEGPRQRFYQCRAAMHRNNPGPAAALPGHCPIWPDDLLPPAAPADRQRH